MRVGVSRASPRASSGSNGAGAVQPSAAERDDLADQRKAVGMHAGRRQAEQTIARRDVRPRQQLAALDRADGEAGEIVIAPRVKARHLGGLAADQRRAGLDAALRDALDDLGAATAGSSLPLA